MSYGIRNTLILILILLLMCGGGYLGLHLRYDENIGVLAQQIEQKKKEFSKLEGYFADLDYYYEEIKTSQERLKSYPKILLPTVEIHQTYRITGNVAYIKDQSNNLLKMKAGDKIYLGYLAKVNLNRGTVTFKMDRGGIKDTVVLNLNPTK